MCTTLSNNYAINFPVSACSGTYSGVAINDRLTVENGKTLTLTNATAGGSAEIVVETNGTLNITPSGGTITIPLITLKGTAKLTVNGTLLSDYIDASLSTVPTGVAVRLTVTGDLTVDGAMTMGPKSATNVTGKLTMSGDPFSFDSTATLIAANMDVLNGGGSAFDGKVTITGTTHFTSNVSGGITVNSCKFQTATLTNDAPANEFSGSGYFKVTSTFNGTNSLTNVSSIRIYKAGGSGNAGSATVLGSAISPEPC